MEEGNRGECLWLHPEDSRSAFWGTTLPYTTSLCFPAGCCCSTQPTQAAFPAPLPQPPVSGEPWGWLKSTAVTTYRKFFNQNGVCDYFDRGVTEVCPVTPDDVQCRPGLWVSTATTSFVGVGGVYKSYKWGTGRIKGVRGRVV